MESPTELEQTVRAFFDEYMEMRPVDATYLGLHDYDGRLPEGGRRAHQAEVSLLERFSAQLDELAAGGLELEAARYFARLQLYQVRDLGIATGMPEAPDQIGTGLFLLFARDHAPLDARLESIASRLEDVPRYLDASRDQLTEPRRLWTQVALETAQQLPELIEIVAAAPTAEAVARRVRAASGPATEAIAAYCRWLESEVIPSARPDYVVGEERFHRLMQLRELPGDPDRILELGRRYLEEVKQQRLDLVAEAWPGKTPAEVNALVQADRAPDFESSLEDYRRCIAEARSFVIDHRLATVPEGEELVVIETPSYLRPVIPFAAYEPAAYFDQRQLGIYVVTPPATPEGLGENNRPSIQNTSVHEGYPGHHLQFVCANRNPSLARLLAGFHATEFIEGWAHYCEQLMYEEGFSAGPEVRFVQLTDLIWRACRIVIDVQLSRGAMSFEDAVAMLVREAGMDRGRAESEVKRYTYSPGYQLSYLYGKHLLLELRERVQSRQGAGFDLLGFHDRLLYAGALPAQLWDRLF